MNTIAPLLEVKGVTLQYKTPDHLVTATYRIDFEVFEGERNSDMKSLGSTWRVRLPTSIKRIRCEIRVLISQASILRSSNWKRSDFGLLPLACALIVSSKSRAVGLRQDS